jgi:tetratricopeptide (TPR) repeat protein
LKRNSSLWLGLAAAGFLALVLAPVHAQAPAADTGQIHGRVINPTGQPQGGGTVSLSTDRRLTPEYTFNVDGSGNYAGEAPQGTYTVAYREADTPDGKIIDSIRGVEIVAGQDTTQDVDMSRQEFIDKLKPEQKRQLEYLKKANARALNANEIINVLNADLKTCNQDFKDGDSALDTGTKAAKYGECETLMLSDTQIKPDASILWVRLGQAQAGLMKYADAESSFKRALELENAATTPNMAVRNLANSELEKIHARTNAATEPAPARRPMPNIAPPPPPADAPPPTIDVGQTMDQVTTSFGQPLRVARVGAKAIFYYKDMKVTFTNGKVTNVE